jgi:D-alanyl-D-alanine carboxypeptidase
LELEPGEELTVLDAIKALVTKSANDVAVALAQQIAGSEVNFARLMTRKAREIGMAHTTFRNASGLPDPEQVTTPRDMLTLALHLQDDFPRHYTLFATRTFTYAGHTHRNHNTLLTRYRGTDGIKTGYTRASGFNLISSVRRDGKHVVGAVFGGETARSRNVRMQSLLNAALAKASTNGRGGPRRPRRAACPRQVAGASASCHRDSAPRPRGGQWRVGIQRLAGDAAPLHRRRQGPPSRSAPTCNAIAQRGGVATAAFAARPFSVRD